MLDIFHKYSIFSSIFILSICFWGGYKLKNISRKTNPLSQTKLVICGSPANVTGSLCLPIVYYAFILSIHGLSLNILNCFNDQNTFTRLQIQNKVDFIINIHIF